MNQTKEQKLIEILDQDPIEAPAEASTDIDAAFPELTEKGKQIMRKVLEAKMLSPQEIEHAEKTAKHNRWVQLKRNLDLKKRELRRSKHGAHSRKHQKKRKK